MNLFPENAKEVEALNNRTDDVLGAMTNNDTRLATQILLATLGPDGPNENKLFSFAHFWIIGVCLVLLVPLVMFVGQLLRWFFQAGVKYAIYWRGATLIMALCVWAAWYGIFPFFGGIFYVMSNIILIGVLCASRLYQALRTGYHFRLWITVTFVCASCCALDILDSFTYISAIMLIAWHSIYRAWDYGWLEPARGPGMQAVDLNWIQIRDLLFPILGKAWWRRALNVLGQFRSRLPDVGVSNILRSALGLTRR